MPRKKLRMLCNMCSREIPGLPRDEQCRKDSELFDPFSQINLGVSMSQGQFQDCAQVLGSGGPRSL